MKYIIFIVLVFLGCNPVTQDIKVTNKAYISEHHIHYFKGPGLYREYIPQKFYIYEEDNFQSKRCEVSKDIWVDIKRGDIVSYSLVSNCVYGGGASINILSKGRVF